MCLPECFDVILEGELKMWLQRYSSSLQEFHQKLRLMPLVNAIKNFIRVFSSC